MTRSLCCYTVNAKFLFQALVSASQLRSLTPTTVTDVAIVCFGEIGSSAKEIKEIFHTLGIILFERPATALQEIPVASARLLLDDLLPPEYENILYLDADTQVYGSVEPIISVPMGSHLALAVQDPMSLVSAHPRKYGKSSIEHFEQLGLNPNANLKYYNSGVIRFMRSDLRDVGKACISLMNEKSNVFRYPDQDALNIVVGKRFGSLSLKWNFPGFLIESRCGSDVHPAIYHFMSNPRPWDGQFWPWGARYFNVYVDFVKRYPVFLNSLSPLSGLNYLKYEVLTQYKRAADRQIWQGRAFMKAVNQNEKYAII